MAIYGSQCVPSYVLPEERDFCSYFDQLKYEETLKNPDNYFRIVKVMNFDILNHECRGDPLEKDLKEHFAIQNKYFVKYPKTNKKAVTRGALKNQNNVKQPLFIQKEFALNHFLNK